MRRAGAISQRGARRAMETAAPGRREYQVEAELIHEFCRRRARAPAYGSIVAAGPNACVLHYRENNAELQQGRAPADRRRVRARGYASDITRTFPIGGASPRRRATSTSWCSQSQEAAIKAVKPGADFIDYHDAATRVLVQGLIDLKLCKGSVDAVLERRLVQAVLHAPHRPLAGPRRARRGRLHAEGQVAQVEARHGAHRRAGPLHPPGGQRARRRSGTSACASRTTCS